MRVCVTGASSPRPLQVSRGMHAPAIVRRPKGGDSKILQRSQARKPHRHQEYNVQVSMTSRARCRACLQESVTPLPILEMQVRESRDKCWVCAQGIIRYVDSTVFAVSGPHHPRLPALRSLSTLQAGTQCLRGTLDRRHREKCYCIPESILFSHVWLSRRYG